MLRISCALGGTLLESLKGKTCCRQSQVLFRGLCVSFAMVLPFKYKLILQYSIARVVPEDLIACVALSLFFLSRPIRDYGIYLNHC
jgi:hypothetical protein